MVLRMVVVALKIPSNSLLDAEGESSGTHMWPCVEMRLISGVAMYDAKPKPFCFVLPSVTAYNTEEFLVMHSWMMSDGTRAEECCNIADFHGSCSVLAG
jgi:hypothetical protein